MISEPLIVIGVCIVLYGAFSKILSRSVISAPMVFMFVGLIAGSGGLGIIEIDIENEALEGFGELTLGLILFADAAATDTRKLLHDRKIPSRLLLIALPLTIAFGLGVALIFFPDLSWQEALLISAILVPTDAALGYAVVTSKAVPERIRQAILVESGLNDGLALPAVLIAAALAYSVSSETAHTASYWVSFIVQQIGVGAAVGIVGGASLGLLVHKADEYGWIDHSFRKLTSIGVAIIVFLGAHQLGGNGFIAAFLGGMAFGAVNRGSCGELTDFVEEEGQLFSLLIFFFFGAVLLPSATEFLTFYCVIYALLSLTLIRMVPSALALTGAGVSAQGKAFIGWFGPRGLASILFLFVAVEHEEGARLTEVEAIVYVTVFLSVFLHGATASLFSETYGKSAAAAKDG